MFQFSDLVRGGELVRDIKQKFPETDEVFVKFGLRPSLFPGSAATPRRRAPGGFRRFPELERARRRRIE